MLNWKASREEHALILEIVKRAAQAWPDVNRMELNMDITAAHLNGCPLDLAKLLAADDNNFGHDVFGIRKYIDRSTGKIGECFVPRYAKRDERPA